MLYLDFQGPPKREFVQSPSPPQNAEIVLCPTSSKTLRPFKLFKLLHDVSKNVRYQFTNPSQSNQTHRKNTTQWHRSSPPLIFHHQIWVFTILEFHQSPLVNWHGNGTSTMNESMYSLLNMLIFHYHVSLLEGKPNPQTSCFHLTKEKQQLTPPTHPQKPSYIFGTVDSLKLTVRTWKWACPKWRSSSNTQFSGANLLLVSGRVYLEIMVVTTWNLPCLTNPFRLQESASKLQIFQKLQTFRFGGHLKQSFGCFIMVNVGKCTIFWWN